MSRTDAIRTELSDAVLFLGRAGRNADEKHYLASRATGLSVRVIERIRYKKIADPKTSISDAIREAMRRQSEMEEERHQHEIFILKSRMASLEARLGGAPRSPVAGT